jgi:hypothetical protein
MAHETATLRSPWRTTSAALKADTKVKTVDFALQWDTGHAGNYDVRSAFAWIDARLAAGN